MKHRNENGFADRRKSAAEAKMQLLRKFAAAPKPDDPEMLAKRAERERRKHEAIKRQQAEAEALRQAEAKAKAEEEAKAKAEADARAADEKRLIELVIANEAERKAKRDARYAARKARQR